MKTPFIPGNKIQRAAWVLLKCNDLAFSEIVLLKKINDCWFKNEYITSSEYRKFLLIKNKRKELFN